MTASFEARRIFLRDPECAGYTQGSKGSTAKHAQSRTSRASRQGSSKRMIETATAAGADSSQKAAGTADPSDGSTGATPKTIATSTSASEAHASLGTTTSTVARDSRGSAGTSVGTNKTVAAATSNGPGLVLRKGPAAACSSSLATSGNPKEGDKKGVLQSRDGRDLLHDVQITYSLALQEAYKEASKAHAERKAKRHEEKRRLEAEAAQAAISAAESVAAASAASTSARKPGTVIPLSTSKEQRIINSHAEEDEGEDEGDPAPVKPEPDAAVLAATASLYQLLSMLSMPTTVSPCVRLCVTGAGLPASYVALLAQQRERDKLQAWRRGGSHIKVVPIDAAESWRHLLGDTGGDKEEGSSEDEEVIDGEDGEGSNGAEKVYKGRKARVGVGKRLVVFNYAGQQEAREVFAGRLR